METIKLKIDEEHQLILDNRGATGLKIMYSCEPEDIVSIERLDNLPITDHMPGSSIKSVYSIRAKQTGQVKVSFYETRVWDENFEPIPVKEFIMTIE